MSNKSSWDIAKELADKTRNPKNKIERPTTCESCQKERDLYDLFCVHCGVEDPLIHQELNKLVKVTSNLKKIREKFNPLLYLTDFFMDKNQLKEEVGEDELENFFGKTPNGKFLRFDENDEIIANKIEDVENELLKHDDNKVYFYDGPNPEIIPEMEDKGYIFHYQSQHWILKDTLNEMIAKSKGHIKFNIYHKSHKNNKRASFIDKDGYKSETDFIFGKYLTALNEPNDFSNFILTYLRSGGLYKFNKTYDKSIQIDEKHSKEISVYSGMTDDDVTIDYIKNDYMDEHRNNPKNSRPCIECNLDISMDYNYCHFCGNVISLSQKSSQKSTSTPYNQGIGVPRNTLAFMTLSFVAFIFTPFLGSEIFLSTWILTIIGSIYLIREMKYFKRFSILLILPNLFPYIGHILILLYLLISKNKAPNKDSNDKGIVDVTAPSVRPDDFSMNRSVDNLVALNEIMTKKFQNTKQQGDEFEIFCAYLLEKEGYIIESVEGGARDRGTDIRAETSGSISTKIAIQCKHYPQKTVGDEVIRVSMGSRELKDEKFDKVAVMTSGTFTKPAIKTATENNVELINYNDLYEFSQKHLNGITLDSIIKYGSRWISTK